MIFEAISLEITSNIKDIEKPSRSRDKGLGQQGEFHHSEAWFAMAFVPRRAASPSLDARPPRPWGERSSRKSP